MRITAPSERDLGKTLSECFANEKNDVLHRACFAEAFAVFGCTMESVQGGVVVSRKARACIECAVRWCMYIIPRCTAGHEFKALM